MPKQINLNKYAIKLKSNKKLSYKPIYNLSLVKLETLKVYIKIYLKIGFIWFFKSSASVLILFNKKPDSSFQLCVDYQELNNLTLKNQYLLFFIGKLLDCLG